MDPGHREWAVATVSDLRTFVCPTGFVRSIELNIPRDNLAQSAGQRIKEGPDL